jgi:hypothetical protein
VSKHTPGPWRFTRNGTIRAPETEKDAFGLAGFSVAEVFHGSDTGIQDDPDALANARLIASAPEMLETIRALLAMPMILQVPAVGAKNPFGPIDRARAILARLDEPA